MNSINPRQSVEKFMARRAGAELLGSSRAMNFGGAGASLALILLIAQIGVGKPSLVWSLGIAAVAFPLWLSLALTYEIWLALKLEFEDMWNLKWLRRVQAFLFYFLALITAVAIGCLLYALHPMVMWVFMASCAVAVILSGAAMTGAAYRLAGHLSNAARNPPRA